MKTYSGGQRFPNQINFSVYIVKAISKRILINIPCIGTWQVQEKKKRKQWDKQTLLYSYMILLKIVWNITFGI
jgi:hypothetical protein